ncbi:MAG: oxidoreductase-like domain-containing protein [Motiliproteus sp.]
MTDNTQKPQPPAANECCGGGSCCPCVWDRYYDQLNTWQQQQGIEPTPKQLEQLQTDDGGDFFR